jgi:hypothetical protein
MSRDEDPEVVADLRLRASSARARPDNGPVAWRQPVIVATWPCRNGACRKPVQVTADGLAAAESARRRYPDIADHELVVCDACREMLNAHASIVCRRRVDGLADKIREYKATRDPHRMAELERELEKARHPDVPGLVQAVRDRREGVANAGAREHRRDRRGM